MTKKIRKSEWENVLPGKRLEIAASIIGFLNCYQPVFLSRCAMANAGGDLRSVFCMRMKCHPVGRASGRTG